MALIKRLLVLGTAAAAAAALTAVQKINTGKKEEKKNHKVDELLGIDMQVSPLIGGVRQYIRIHGRNKKNPILLLIHGGPGNSTSAVSYQYEREWDSMYTVVTWDQRGCGLSEASEGPLTINEFVSDTKEVAEYLNRLLPDCRIVLFGQNWGTVIGALAAFRYPSLFAAYIGAGQITDVTCNSDTAFQHAKECAARDGDTDLLEELEKDEQTEEVKYLSQSYSDAQMKYHFLTVKYQTMNDYAMMILKTALRCPYLSITDSLKSCASGFSNEGQYLDFMKSEEFKSFRLSDYTEEYEIPFILLEGDHDWQTPYPIAKEYFKKVKAPYKKWDTLINCAHLVQYDNIEQVTENLKDIREII
ncbi:MAG: alpha/beta hydrolase [Erysipelotrichia bacterium]|nr:alpha/beta hydrolase [Erysipelotrichia bacterium]